MKHALLTFILAAMLNLAPVLSAQAMEMPVGETMGDHAAPAMMMDDCAECDDCDENPEMPNCAKNCQSACAAGTSLTILSHRVAEVATQRQASYGGERDDPLTGALPTKDLPPPRI